MSGESRRARSYGPGPVVLAGDVGGTNTRLALFAGSEREPVALEVYPSAEHSSLDKIAAAFMAEHAVTVEAASVGVAGPVRAGRTEAVNLAWAVDASQLTRTLGLAGERVSLLNDVEAAAWGVLEIPPGDLRQVKSGTALDAGNVALLALGTGLGVAFVTFGPEGPRVHATEGGHTDFGPRTPLEVELREWMAARDDHVSYENVCSGIGLVNVYEFLRSRTGEPDPEGLAGARGQPGFGRAITVAGLERSDPVATQALDLVVSIYGAQAGNLALAFTATGGVYLGGGIIPRILPLLLDGLFGEAFTSKGRLSPLVEAIPVHAVLNELTGLLGAAHHAREVLNR